MNIPRMTELRDFLLTVPAEKLNMARWFIQNGWDHDEVEDVASPEDILHTCGTSACIAGWTVSLFKTPDNDGYGEIPHLAQELLGLTDNEARILFGTTTTHLWLSDITHEMAIKALTKSIKLGYVPRDVYS